jgi:hypothetical protein
VCDGGSGGGGSSGRSGGGGGTHQSRAVSEVLSASCSAAGIPQLTTRGLQMDLALRTGYGAHETGRLCQPIENEAKAVHRDCCGASSQWASDGELRCPCPVLRVSAR